MAAPSLPGVTGALTHAVVATSGATAAANITGVAGSMALSSVAAVDDVVPDDTAARRVAGLIGATGIAVVPVQGGMAAPCVAGVASDTTLSSVAADGGAVLGSNAARRVAGVTGATIIAVVAVPGGRQRGALQALHSPRALQLWLVRAAQ